MIAFKITDELKQRIKALAEKEDRSISYICQRAMENEVKKSKKR